MSAILIAGANRGVGLALARAYAENKENMIVATCRTPERAEALHALAAETPNVRIAQLDVTSRIDRRNLVESLDGIALDVFVHVAGILSGADGALDATERDPSQSLGTLDEKAWLGVMHVNALAPVMLTEALLPALKRSKERKIGLVSSRWGSIAQAEQGHFAYRSSKAALNMGMRCLAAALKEEGFSVVSLNPGWVRTRMGGTKAALSAAESARRLKKIMDSLSPEQSGSFLSHDGSVVAW